MQRNLQLPKYELTIEYKYDHLGNWTSIKCYNTSGMLVEWKEREYKYTQNLLPYHSPKFILVNHLDIQFGCLFQLGRTNILARNKQIGILRNG